MLTRMSFFEKNNEKAQRDGWALRFGYVLLRAV